MFCWVVACDVEGGKMSIGSSTKFTFDKVVGRALKRCHLVYDLVSALFHFGRQ